MIEKIKECLWQLYFQKFGSCIYVIKTEEDILVIDTGSLLTTPELKQDLIQLKISPLNVTKVILTHNHFDHIGNINLFEKAEIYGDKNDFQEKHIKDINDLKINGFQVIKTPGHTKGSISLYMPKEKILFSGDTLFHNGFIGRTDLPNNEQEKMPESLKKLTELDYEILCPGHIL